MLTTEAMVAEIKEKDKVGMQGGGGGMGGMYQAELPQPGLRPRVRFDRTGEATRRSFFVCPDLGHLAN